MKVFLSILFIALSIFLWFILALDYFKAPVVGPTYGCTMYLKEAHKTIVKGKEVWYTQWDKKCGVMRFEDSV